MSLRVLIVTESFLPQINGVTNSVCRVLDHLATRSDATGGPVEAAVIAPTGPAEYAGFAVLKVRGASLPFYKEFRLGLETRGRLRSIFERFGPDVIHVASPATLGYQAVKAARDLAIPTVGVHQTDLVGFAERYRVLGATGGSSAAVRAAAGLTRSIHEKVDLTLAPSSASLRQLTELGIDRTALWPRGVDTALFGPERRDARLRLDLAPHGETILGYVGRLAPEKELGLLADLAADPRYTLALIGGGPERERLQALMPRARFLGVLHGEQLAAAYASLDVFVHAGRHETFCQSAQEALASGVPVVAPRQGGPIDVVDDLKSGFLYEPGSAPQLRRFVDCLHANPRLGRRMGRFGRARVEGRSWETVNDLLLDHYRTVIRSRRAGARDGDGHRAA